MRAPFLEDDAMNRVVREDVARRVVDERRRHTTKPGSQLEVVEDGLDAFSGQVASEEKAGCLDHAFLPRFAGRGRHGVRRAPELA